MIGYLHVEMSVGPVLFSVVYAYFFLMVGVDLHVVFGVFVLSRTIKHKEQS